MFYNNVEDFSRCFVTVIVTVECFSFVAQNAYLMFQTSYECLHASLAKQRDAIRLGTVAQQAYIKQPITFRKCFHRIVYCQ